MGNKNPEVGLVGSDGNAHLLTRAARTLVLEQPVWDDMRVSMLAARVPATAGPDFAQFKDNGSSSTGVFMYWFDDSTEEQVYFNCQFSHDQMLNTPVVPHIHWTPAADGTSGQVVSWGLEYTWMKIGGDFADTTIIYSSGHVPADDVLVGGRHYISSFGEISGATGAVSNMLVCRLFRDAAGTGGTDDLAQDAGALYFDFHYQKDTLGSRTQLEK